MINTNSVDMDTMPLNFRGNRARSSKKSRKCRNDSSNERPELFTLQQVFQLFHGLQRV